MFNSHFKSRIGCLVSCGVVAFLYANPAHSESCSSTYKSAQEKEKAGQLLEAREFYSTCAKRTCGQFLLNECTTRHARLDSDIPSVVPIATHVSGKPYPNVRVTLDGEPFATSLDGRSLQVNPGLHVFAFTAEDGASLSEEVLILQGDRNRRVSVSLAPKQPKAVAAARVPEAEPPATEEASEKPPRMLTRPPRAAPVEAPPEPRSSGGVPTATWLLGGLGVLGGGSYVLFSSWGKKDNDALQQQCAPSCQQSSVDHVKQRFLIADISLGVGVAALGSALLVYALHSPKEEPAPEHQAYAVQVHPTPAGAVASFSGSF